MRPLLFALGCSIAACALLAAPVPRPEESSFRSSAWGKPIDPDKDCKFTFGKGSLAIEVPGKDHDLEPGRKRMNAPRLLRSVEGDFRVEVRVSGSFTPSRRSSAAKVEPFASAGLMIEATDKLDTRLLLEFGSQRERGDAIGFTQLRSVTRWGGSGCWQDGPGSKNWPLTKESKHAFLRLERLGTEVRYFVSADGKKWKKYPGGGITLRLDLPKKVRVGLFAASTSTSPVKVTFDQFKLTPLKPKSP